jgi:RimJ/RimL family protein N-acetyltransferase
MRFPARLVTPRTVLRAWRPDDGPLLKAAIDYNRDHLKPWVPWANGELTPLEETRARVTTFAEEFAADRNWVYAVLSPDESRVIGGTGFHNRIAPGGLEIGYWIDRDHINQGLATEVAGALVEVGFADPDLLYLEMHIDARNLASARVPEHLGFTLVERRSEPVAAGSDETRTMMIWRLHRGDDE